jgi:protein-S-isoprenylcysteine O-methyltransferase Ste14
LKVGQLELFVTRGPVSVPAILLHLIDALALFYLILLLWIPFYWFLFHSALRFWRRVGTRSFWMALPVWLIFAVSIVEARHGLFSRRFGRSPLTWIAGAVLFVLASWLGMQTRHAFGWRRLAGLPELNPAHPLGGVIDTGIYARLRHPRYALYMLMLFSMAFLTGAQPIFLLAILNVVLYHILALLEERKLLDQYGPQYEVYQRSVPRFVPHLGRKCQARFSP